jgi:tetratricopeptide (TPR) repeat protein
LSKAKGKIRHIVLMFLLTGVVSMWAQTDQDAQLDSYAAKYIRTPDAKARLKIANEFFAFLHSIDYIDEPRVFPDSAYIDSVDLNVYYYIAEWYYVAGAYAFTADYCTRATHCMGIVDDVSKSDVYSLLGAAYFRLSEFDKAVEALNESYLLDKKSGDFDRMSSTLNGIASVFSAAGKPEEAEKYILESIAANSLTDNLSRRAVLLGTASEIYRSLERKKESLDYAQQALNIERQLGDSTRISGRLSQVANAQLGLAKTEDAKHTLLEAMPM